MPVFAALASALPQNRPKIVRLTGDVTDVQGDAACTDGPTKGRERRSEDYITMSLCGQNFEYGVCGGQCGDTKALGAWWE